MDLEAAKAQFAPQILESLAVAVGQFPFRTLLQPADRNHDEAHEDFPASMPSERRIEFARHAKQNLRASRCAQASLHKPEPISHRLDGSQSVFAVGPCVHNLSRL